MTMPQTDKPMLACGHRANATSEGKPACAICVGTHSGAMIPVAAPDLTERTARCSCGTKQPSLNPRLAFFEYLGPESPAALHRCRCGYYDSAHQPGERYQVKDHPFEPHGAYEFDSYYCGHNGWD